ncbi:MAG: glycosyltransferase family 2 protein [Candidatus Choladocola sp.]|nr:glycosyltransferase family 2 protein [Candidatus Choladocola sp.]
MKKICSIVVTYNRKEILLECIAAILSQTYPVHKLIILDNNSTDNTKEYLLEKGLLERTEIVYERLSTNTGGAGGFYYGMKKASEYEPDWYWIMDDDVIPTRNCLEELVNANEIIENKVSFLASSVRGINGEPMNVPKILKESTETYVDWYQYLDSGIIQIRKATFVSLLINCQAVKKCGYPWKEFFIWGDDSEYTQRIIRDFGPAYMVGKSKVVHKRKGGDALSIVKEENKKRIDMYFYYYRNNLIGYWEYENVLYRFLCMGKLGYDFVLTLVKGKYKLRKMKVIIKAFFSFVFGMYNKKSFKNRATL